MDYDDDINWFCDFCDAYLNRQPGFTTEHGTWQCKRCGVTNDVTENNILTDEECEDLVKEECPNCGGHMAKFLPLENVWECEDCGSCYEILYNDNDDDNECERISVYEAAMIWASNGKDEDYMFGYTKEELEDALK